MNPIFNELVSQSDFLIYIIRDIGQGSSEEVRNKDLKRDLEEREKTYKDKGDRKDRERERQIKAAPSSISAQ